MRENLERELKLVPPAGFRLPPGLGGVELPDRAFVSTYHDTKDLRLARNGVTFRHRIEDGTGLWQLKLPRGAARVELEQPGPPSRAPADLVALLPAYLRGEPLTRVARLKTRRKSVRTDGAEIVDDSVAILDGQRITGRFRELEVEFLDGDERTLRRLERALRRAGATVPGAFEPKLFRALELAYPAEQRDLTPDTAPIDAIGAALGQQYRRLLAHDPGVRLGVEAEDVHQMRVATRRARAFLKVGHAFVAADWAEGLRAELGWLGSALGPARDLDVLLDRLRVDLADLGEEERLAGLLESLELERVSARAAAIEALEDERYLRLLDRLEAAEEPPAAADAGTETLAGVWSHELKRLRRTFARPGRRFDRPRAPQGADSRQTGAVRGGARRARARRPGTAVRRGGEEAPGRPRRAPGRVRGVGAAHGVGRRSRPGRPGREATPRARESSSPARTLRVAEGVEAGPARRSGGAEEAVIRAAGGVVVQDRDGAREILLVHRPAYDDWSFPKGKAMPDESDEQCAIREVEEETGLVCELLDELPSTSYRDAKGRPKRVRYWLMHPVGGRLVFEHEVDEARWLRAAEAREALTYARDRTVVDACRAEGT